MKIFFVQMRDIDNVLYTNQKHMMRLLEMLHTRLMYHYKGHINKIGNCLWINKHHSSEFIYYECKKIIVFLNYIVQPILVNILILLIHLSQAMDTYKVGLNTKLIALCYKTQCKFRFLLSSTANNQEHYSQGFDKIFDVKWKDMKMR